LSIRAFDSTDRNGLSKDRPFPVRGATATDQLIFFSPSSPCHERKERREAARSPKTFMAIGSRSVASDY
jgi:hypothetical protein